MSRSRARRRHRGMAVVYIAIILTVLIGVVGLACDTAYVFLTAHQLQNAADTAALSGAEELGFSTSQAATNAVNTAADNTAAQASVQLATTDVTIGNYNRTTATFTANGTPYNAVKVVARRTSGSPGGALNLFFAPIFGITTSNVSRQAIAMTTPISAGLLVLDPTDSGTLSLTGSGSRPKVDITNGGIVVNSSSSSAVSWNGNPTMVGTSLDIVGDQPGVSSIYSSGTLSTPGTTVNDPYASLPAPPKGTTRTGTTSPFQPGYYANGLTGTLAGGGIYYVDGGVSNVTCTTGCMIYVNSGAISGDLNIAPMTTGTYAGISIFQARTNTTTDTFKGNSTSSTGVFYIPDAALVMKGTPTSFGSQLICYTISIVGNSQVSITYNTAYDIQRHEAFLVQ